MKPLHCHKVGVCQFIKAKGKLNKVTVMDCHITITPGFSVRVRCLVMRNEAAKMGEEASITKLYQPPVPVNLGSTTTITPADLQAELEAELAAQVRELEEKFWTPLSMWLPTWMLLMMAGTH